MWVVQDFRLFILSHTHYQTKRTTRCEVDDRDGNYTITLEHDFGMKYSNQLKRVYEAVTRETLGIEPKIEVTNNSIFIRFSERSPKATRLPG